MHKVHCESTSKMQRFGSIRERWAALVGTALSDATHGSVMQRHRAENKLRVSFCLVSVDSWRSALGPLHASHSRINLLTAQ
jgi:hypothetical protein